MGAGSSLVVDGGFGGGCDGQFSMGSNFHGEWSLKSGKVRKALAQRRRPEDDYRVLCTLKPSSLTIAPCRYDVCAVAPAWPQCMTTFTDPLLNNMVRIPDPPSVPVWTQAAQLMLSRKTDLNQNILSTPPYPAQPGSGTGAPWGASTTLASPSFTGAMWDVKSPYVEMCACAPGKWAFTYDDGPLNEMDFLPMLAKYNIKASFFVIGGVVLQHPDALLAAYKAGHQIGIHTWTHPFTSTKPTDEIISETLFTAMAIYNVTGVVPRYWRPPKGDIDDRVRGIMSSLGLRIAMWNIDSKDYTINDTAPATPYPWTATNATQMLSLVFQNGFMSNPWAAGGDVNNASSWTNVTWLPGGPQYQGFISLEHELTLGDLAIAETYIQTVLNTPYNFFQPGNGVNGKFTPATVAECDQAVSNSPYLGPSDPFYNMVVYWHSQLPITPAVIAATSGYPVDFAQPVTNWTPGSGGATGGPTGTIGDGKTPGATASVLATTTKSTSTKNAAGRAEGGWMAAVVGCVGVLAVLSL
ncbi:chitin deacetylase [Irineochytrium annulatum]|nr:chitin deacetylase [Irineochytrium annulatum]